MLPEECIYKCMTFLNNIDLQNVYFMRSEYLNKLKSFRYMQKKQKRIPNKVYTHLKWLNTFPFIKNISDDFVGMTGYIDRIKPSDLTSPIMIGMDNSERYYVCVRYKCLDPTFEFDNDTIKVDTTKVNCITIFQRYSSDDSCWCRVDRYSRDSPFMIHTNTRLGIDDVNCFIRGIFQMMTKSLVEYYDYESRFQGIPTIKRYCKCVLV